MTDSLTVAGVQAMLDASPYIRGCGMKVAHLDAKALEIAIELSMRPEFERRAGTGQWHGGPIAALIDTAGDYALALHAGGPVPTINFRTDYLRPAVDTSLTATARVRRAGRTVGVVDIDVTDDQGRLVAVGRGSYGTRTG